MTRVLRRQALTALAGSTVALGPIAVWPRSVMGSTRGPIPVPPAKGQILVLPGFKLINGHTLPPAHFEGRTTVLYWWASWCPYCREQTPEMQKLWERHASSGLRFIAISVDRDLEVARRHLLQGRYTFPCAWFADELAAVFERPLRIPVTAVVDRRAQVVFSARGQMFPEDIAGLSEWM